MKEIRATLEERGSRYGVYSGHAFLSQQLKEISRQGASWRDLNTSQKEAVEMILHKVARILNGDPNYADSWRDIAGYAHLVELELSGEHL